jgi:hypothetical protein
VDLAVDGLDLPVGTDVDARVEALLGLVRVLVERSRDQVDPQLRRGAPRPVHRLAVQGLGSGGHVLARAQHGPLLREDDKLRAVGGGVAHKAIGPLQVTIGVVGGVHLDGGCAHWGPS